MDYNRLGQESVYGGDTTTSIMQRFRISSLGLLRSVPTVRGGFAMGLGYSSPWLIDDINNATGNDSYKGAGPLIGYTDTVRAGGKVAIEKSNHASKGQLNLWNAGAGWQIAPELGFGISIGLLMGDEVQKIELVKNVGGAEFENLIATSQRSFLSYDARLGLLYNPMKELSLGCRLELPRLWSIVAENYSENDEYYGPWNQTNYGKLQSPFAGAIGAALQLPYVTVTSDATFRAPLDGAEKGDDLSYWKEGIGIGVEIPAQWLGGVVRGGYSYSKFDPSPMQIKWDDPQPGDSVIVKGLHGSHLLTAGYSLFLGNSVSFDLAYGYVVSEYAMANPDWENVKTVTNGYQRGMASLSVRY
jgi:hypothetical protein